MDLFGRRIDRIVTGPAAAPFALPGYADLRPQFRGGPRRLAFERAGRARGYACIAGVDEAGRGPLAGPVVAAAVVLPQRTPPHALRGLRDSKQLAPDLRRRLYHQILDHALDFGIGIVGERIIDRINILQASLLAMRRAVACLRAAPDLLLVDGLHAPAVPGDRQPIVTGDDRSLSIAAASVLAKVTRDAVMEQYHGQFPNYRFAEHKGYPTPDHLQALARHGPCPIHRMTFQGVCDRSAPPAPGLWG
jgi:ribonuclease HII